MPISTVCMIRLLFFLMNPFLTISFRLFPVPVKKGGAQNKDRDTPDVSNVQKCADFVHVFMLGFDIAGVVALLRLDDIYVDFFEIP